VRVLELDDQILMTAARGRNAGAYALIKSPEIEFIQFIDGDCELVSGWLEQAVNFLENNPNVGAVCGLRMERNPGMSIYNQLAEREWRTPIGLALSTGGDALVRVSAFRAVCGFRDDQVAHEEPEFCARLRADGWQIWRLDCDMTVHDAATFRFRDYYRRSRRAGFGIMQAILCHNGSLDRSSNMIIVRAIFWSAIFLLSISLTIVFADLAFLILNVMYILQWIRIFMREYRALKCSVRAAAICASLNIASKFAEADGAVRAVWHHFLKRPRGAS